MSPLEAMLLSSPTWPRSAAELAFTHTALRAVIEAKGSSVILALNQYNCIGCSPGRHRDTRTMAIGSDDDSRDSVHDKRLGIAV